MLEKFSKEEIDQILVELKKEGYKIQGIVDGKTTILDREAKSLGLDCYKIGKGYTTSLKSPIFEIADMITGNYEKRAMKSGGHKTFKRPNSVDPDIAEEWRMVCHSVLAGIKKFCDEMRDINGIELIEPYKYVDYGARQYETEAPVLLADSTAETTDIVENIAERDSKEFAKIAKGINAKFKVMSEEATE